MTTDVTGLSRATARLAEDGPTRLHGCAPRALEARRRSRSRPAFEGHSRNIVKRSGTRDPLHEVAIHADAFGMYDRTIRVLAAGVMAVSTAMMVLARGDLRVAGVVSLLMILYPVARSPMPALIRGGLVAATLVVTLVWYVGDFTVRTYAVAIGFAVFLLGSLMNEDLDPKEGSAM